MEENVYWYSMIYDDQILPFAFGAAITSICFILVDWLYFLVNDNEESLLGITYRPNNFFIVGLTWFVGGFLVSYFSVLFGMLNQSTQAMIAIGAVWPYGFTKLVDSSKSMVGSLEDIEEVVSDVEDLSEEEQ